MSPILAQYERYLEQRYYSVGTRGAYLSDTRVFLRSQSEMVLAATTAADIDAFVRYQTGLGLKPATINRRLASVHSFFEFLASVHIGHNRLNPVVRRRHFLKTEKQLPRDASDEDVASLFAVMDGERDRAIFGLMVGAGLRVGEVSAIRLTDVEIRNVDSGAPARLRITGKGGKERIVWLTNAYATTLQDWLCVRPEVASDRVFLNLHRQPITVSGIQYRLRTYCKVADVSVTCHQLRHTYARRLIEHGLPVDSLARLLGHRHLKTTQRYIEGANPALQADFDTIMGKLQTNLVQDTEVHPLPPPRPSPLHPRNAPVSELERLRPRLSVLPSWLAEGMDDYLSWRWPTWRAQTAFTLGRNTISLVNRLWSWLSSNRKVVGWRTLTRRDLEAWLASRQQDSVTWTTIRNDLAQLQSVLRFLESRDYAIDPGLFRVRPPRNSKSPLPRYLQEADYGWLETSIMQATSTDTFDAYFDRAWFLVLAHTGMRLSELLDLRLGDLNLARGSAVIRGGKPSRDRVVYLTSSLVKALARYLQARPSNTEFDHVFITESAPPCSRTIQRRLARYGKHAGVEVTPHRLRHTFATRLLNAGMPLYGLRKLLGHQDLNTTQHYARVYDETLLKQFQEASMRIEASARAGPGDQS